MVDIVPTILGKISSAAVFIADLTPICTTVSGKRIPNPNVMVELGWAFHRPGWERVIAVINEASGATINDLPFDIRQRRVITYSLSEEANKAERQTQRSRLVQALASALTLNLSEHIEEVAAAQRIEGTAARSDNPSVWATLSGNLVHNDSLGVNNKSSVRVPEGARSYMRIIPSAWKETIPAIADIGPMTKGPKVEAPSHRAISGSYGATEEGFVRYWMTGGSKDDAEASNVVSFFEDTGELWMLHGTIGFDNGNAILLDERAMLAHWSITLREATVFFDHYHAAEARRVEAGVFGIGQMRWPARWQSEQTPARRNAVYYEKQGRDWSSVAQIAFLTKAYNAVRNLFGLPRLSEAEVTQVLKEVDSRRFP